MARSTSTTELHDQANGRSGGPPNGYGTRQAFPARNPAPPIRPGTRPRRRARAAHTALISRLTAALTVSAYRNAFAAAGAAELVRGYENVKLRNIERYRDRLRELGA